MKHSRVINALILIFGILCLMYYFGMGFAVRFGQSLLFLWLLMGLGCIARFIIFDRSIRGGKQLPFSPGLLKAVHICLAAGLAVFVFAECFICSGVFVKPEPELDCIIVLGAKVNGTQPSGALAQRISAAAEYLHDNPGTLCIASGGQGPDEGISEAECIRRNLEALGIEPERIFTEDESTSTLSNIQNSLRLLPDAAENIGIVTNDFHIFRALATARHVSQSLSFSGIPAASTGYGFTHYALREFFAVGGGILKGELSFRVNAA